MPGDEAASTVVNPRRVVHPLDIAEPGAGVIAEAEETSARQAEEDLHDTATSPPGLEGEGEKEPAPTAAFSPPAWWEDTPAKPRDDDTFADPAADQTAVKPPPPGARGLIGRVLCQRYRITRYLGGGGMGKVYYASDEKLDREVAVKVINTELTRDPDFIERFRREAQILARIQHPNVVPVFDRGEEAGLHFFVMALVTGAGGEPQNLGELIKAGITVPTVLRLMKQALEALHAVHLAGVIHRDLKPGNFLIDAGGNAMLADFGIARSSRLSEGELSLTATGSSAHTPEYAAPEQMSDPTKVDARSDVYAMGVVFYKTLTGNLPSGWGDDFQPASRARPGEVWPAIDEVIATAMRKNPADRYQSAADMLRGVQEAEGRAQDTVNLSAGGSRGRVDLLELTEPPRKRARRGGFPVKLVLAVLLLLGGGGAVGYYMYWPRPALFWQALKKGDAVQVTDLLSRRSSLSTAEDPDAPGVMPVDFALKGDRLDLVRILRQHGGRETPDENGQTLLHRAVDSGDAERVEKLLGGGVDADTPDKHGRTPLFIAISNRNAKLADRLIRAEAKVDMADATGRTPLLVAVTNLDHESRDVLLARRPNLDAVDANKNAALQVALAKKDTATFTKLLEAGAKPNPVPSPWDSPLHLATARQAPDLVAALLERGADVNAVDTLGHTPVMLAVISRWREGLGALLEKKPDLGAKDADGRTALHLAVGKDDVSVEVARRLMAAGAKVEAADNAGRTALHAAAERRAAALAVLMLTGHKERADAKDAQGKRPVDLLPPADAADADANATYVAIAHFDLLDAIRANDMPRVKALSAKAREDKRTDPNTSDGQNLLHYAAIVGFGGDVRALVNELYPAAVAKDGGVGVINQATVRRQLTPLHVAAIYDRADAVKALLAAGARIDPLGEGQQTPLHKAAAEGSLDALKALLDDGSPDVTLKDAAGKDAVALSAGAPLAAPIARAIKDYHQPELWARFLANVAADAIEPVRVQVNENPRVPLRARDKEGRTGLIIAAERGNKEIVQLLIKMPGGDRLLKMTDAQGRGPLHAAAANGRLAVVELLKAAYPKAIDETDNRGNTPLHLALGWRAEGSDVDVKLAVVDRLLSGDNWAVRNSDQRTPWVIAKDTKDAQVLGRFITHRALVGGTKAKPLEGVRREDIEDVFKDLGKVDGLDYDELFVRTRVRGPAPGFGVNVLHRTAPDDGEASVQLTAQVCERMKKPQTLADGLRERLHEPGAAAMTPDAPTAIDIAARAGNSKFLGLVFARAAEMVKQSPGAVAAFAPLANQTIAWGAAADAKPATMLAHALRHKDVAFAASLIDCGATIAHADVQAMIDGGLDAPLTKVIGLSSGDQIAPPGLGAAKFHATAGGPDEPLVCVAVRLKKLAMFEAMFGRTTDRDVRWGLLRLVCEVAEADGAGDSPALLGMLDLIMKDDVLARAVDSKGADGKLPEQLITKDGAVRQRIAGARVAVLRARNSAWAQKFLTQNQAKPAGRFARAMENWQIQVAEAGPNGTRVFRRVADVGSSDFEITTAGGKYQRSRPEWREDERGNGAIIFRLARPLDVNPALQPNGNLSELVVVGGLPADDADPKSPWFGNENVRLINVP